MLKQDFTTKSLLNITTLNEIIKFDMGRNKDDYNDFLNNCSNEIISNNFSLDFILKSKIKGKTIYTISEPSGYYALKKYLKTLRNCIRFLLKIAMIYLNRF